jgi:uncharacterized membrane protein
MKIVYLEKYPLVSFILYGVLLLWTIHHLKEHINRLNRNEDTEFIKFLLVCLIILSIYEFFNTSEEVVKSGHSAIQKLDKTIENIKNKNHKTNQEKNN